MFMEQLHARGHAVGDPEAAALFFVPVMVMQMAGNLWHPYEFLTQTVHRLRHAYPYWNRSAGTDHIFFLTTDRGGCWKPWALQHSMIISYLGFRASEAYFGFEERLEWPRRGPQTRNNAYSTRRGARAAAEWRVCGQGSGACAGSGVARARARAYAMGRLRVSERHEWRRGGAVWSPRGLHVVSA